MTNSITVDGTSALKDKFGNLTHSQAEEAREREADAETAEVMEVGQDNEKRGLQVAAQVVDLEEEAKKKKAEDALNSLEMKKRFGTSYLQQMAQVLSDYLKMLEWIPGWRAEIVVTTGAPITIRGKLFATQNGILLVVLATRGRVFHQGIRTSLDPTLDYAAMMTLALQTENQLDKERGLLDSRQRTNTDHVIKIAGEDHERSSGIITSSR